MQAAARVAHTFTLDPVAVLDERDPITKAVRLAAHNVVMADLRRHDDADTVEGGGG